VGCGNEQLQPAEYNRPLTSLRVLEDRAMSSNSNLVRWSLAIASAIAFVIGAFAPGVGRTFTDGMVVTVSAQDPVQEPPDTRSGAGRGGQTAPQPYAQVVTGAFKTDDGIFKVHRGMRGGTDSVLFEIP